MVHFHPLQILPQALDSLISQAANTPVGEKFYGAYVHPQTQIFGRVAVIPILGIIYKDCSALEAYLYDFYDISLLSQQLDLVAEDVSIESVVFYINSPGGVSLGVSAISEKIASLSKNKKTIAYTDSICASAAYSFAAACSLILAEPDALVGSISTMASYIDQSKAFEMNGLERILFRTGELKGIATSGKPWTEEEKAFVQSTVDHADKKFKSFVSSQRPQIQAADMNGGAWAADAAPRGFVDAFALDLTAILKNL